MFPDESMIQSVRCPCSCSQRTSYCHCRGINREFSYENKQTHHRNVALFQDRFFKGNGNKDTIDCKHFDRKTNKRAQQSLSFIFRPFLFPLLRERTITGNIYTSTTAKKGHIPPLLNDNFNPQ